MMSIHQVPYNVTNIVQFTVKFPFLVVRFQNTISKQE